MGWIAFYALVAVGLIVALAVWRKWISPWKDARELADDIVEQRPRQSLGHVGQPGLGGRFRAAVRGPGGCESQLRV